MTDLHNLNDLLGALEGIALQTSQGSYVKMEDVKRLIEERNTAREIDAAEPKFKGKTFAAANQAVKRDPAFAGMNPGPREPGHSVSAQEPQPPSRA